MHRFRIHGEDYGIPQPGGISFDEDARWVLLSRFRLYCGERFRYEYDFIADWRLDVRLERVLPLDAKVPTRCASAEGERRRRRIAAEFGTTWNDWTSTDIHSRNWPVMAEAVQQLLDSGGDRNAIGDLDELREAVQRVEAYQEFQPERFQRRPVSRQLRAIHREVRP